MQTAGGGGSTAAGGLLACSPHAALADGLQVCGVDAHAAAAGAGNQVQPTQGEGKVGIRLLKVQLQGQ
jgi:hypothetical protein